MACRASQAQGAEIGRRSAGQQDGPHCLEADVHGGDLHRGICVCPLGGCKLEISQTRGATQPQPCCAGARTCKMTSRWCDRIDPRYGTLRKLQWPFIGRSCVWNPCRGNHLGQRSRVSALKGRTYGRKRSDHNTAKSPCEGGAVHICSLIRFSAWPRAQ